MKLEEKTFQARVTHVAGDKWPTVHYGPAQQYPIERKGRELMLRGFTCLGERADAAGQRVVTWGAPATAKFPLVTWTKDELPENKPKAKSKAEGKAPGKAKKQRPPPQCANGHPLKWVVGEQGDWRHECNGMYRVLCPRHSKCKRNDLGKPTCFGFWHCSEGICSSYDLCKQCGDAVVKHAERQQLALEKQRDKERSYGQPAFVQARPRTDDLPGHDLDLGQGATPRKRGADGGPAKRQRTDSGVIPLDDSPDRGADVGEQQANDLKCVCCKGALSEWKHVEGDQCTGCGQTLKEGVGALCKEEGCDFRVCMRCVMNL